MARWDGAVGRSCWLVPSKDPSSQPGHRGFLVKRQFLRQQEKWPSAPQCSCFSGGCTRCLPVDLDVTLAHLSLPKNLVLLLLNSDVKGSLDDEARRDILEVPLVVKDVM